MNKKLLMAFFTSQSAGGYDLEAYDSKVLEFPTTAGIEWKPDGTKFYRVNNNTDVIEEYDAGGAWRLTSISLVQSVSVNNTSITDLFWRPNGDELFVSNRSSDSIEEQNASTSWDISTLSFIQSQGFNFPQGFYIRPDQGTRLWIANPALDEVRQFGISAWDITTLSEEAHGDDIGNRAAVTWRGDGTRFYTNNTSGQLNQWDVTSNWDMANRSSAGTKGPSILSSLSYHRIRGNGEQIYISGNDGTNNIIIESILDVAWDITTMKRTKGLDAQDSNLRGGFWKPDGTKYYEVSGSRSRIYEYNVSTPWDEQTATLADSFQPNSDWNIGDIEWKPDGSKLYFISYQPFSVVRIREYDASTNWEVAGVSSVNAKAPETEGLTGITWKPDGSKLYEISTGNGGEINELDAGTNWDLSTVSFVQTAATEGSSPEGISWKPDGTKLFYSDSGTLLHYAIDPGTEWEIGSLSLDKTLRTLDGSPRKLIWGEEGARLYEVAGGDDITYQYEKLP